MTVKKELGSGGKTGTPDPVVEDFRPELSHHDENGREIPDSRPLMAPVPFRRPRSLEERVRELVVGGELARIANARGIDTFEEADDFECEDDDTFDRATPWEDRFDPAHPGVAARIQEEVAGVSEPITREKVKAARELLRRYAQKAQRRKGDRRASDEEGEDGPAAGSGTKRVPKVGPGAASAGDEGGV